MCKNSFFYAHPHHAHEHVNIRRQGHVGRKEGERNQNAYKRRLRMTEIEELIEFIRSDGPNDKAEEIYQQIRRQLLKELKFSDFRLTRLLAMLLDLYRTDRKLFEIILVFMASPLQSMSDLGRQLGVNKSTAWRALRRAAGIHPEIELLLKLRLREVKQGPQQNDDRRK